MDIILGLLMLVHHTPDGDFLTLATQPAEYKTVQECLDQAYDINKDKGTDYVLVCAPKVAPEDFIDSSKKGTGV